LHAGQALVAALENYSEVLQKAVNRLRLVPVHDALVLLRSSFSAPRLMHILRCSPCHGHPALTAFNDLIQMEVSLITNSKLSDIQWVRACLPIRNSVETARQTWSSLHDTDPPAGLSANLKCSWDTPVIQRDMRSVLIAASIAEDCARLLAIKSLHAIDRLLALLISSRELRLDHKAVRIAVGLRLGLHLC
jgi:hypothetical protein